jgi:hypothetical protein
MTAIDMTAIERWIVNISSPELSPMTGQGVPERASAYTGAERGSGLKRTRKVAAYIYTEEENCNIDRIVELYLSCS